MYNFIKKLMLLILLSVATNAGDPCPISYNFYDAGVPQWLDRDDILEALGADSSKKDPLLRKLMAYTKKQDCSKTKMKTASFDLKQSIKEKTFVNVKSFNCRRAHKKLKKIKGLHSGDVVLVRGSRRVLISHVGWNTICVNSSSYNGKYLTQGKLERLYDDLFSEYISDRFENP